jgi:NADH-quinone oxidoreductase subunit I
MIKVDEQWKQNKKGICHRLTLASACVSRGLCVDACPFHALFMTNDYELYPHSRKNI